MLIKPIFQVLHPFLGEGKETTFRWQKQEITSWHWKMMKFQWCEDKRCLPTNFVYLEPLHLGKKNLSQLVHQLRVGWFKLISGYFGYISKVEMLDWSFSCQPKTAGFLSRQILEFPRLQKKTSCVKKEEPTVVFFYLGIGTLQVNFLKWIIFKMSFNSTWRSWNFS